MKRRTIAISTMCVLLALPSGALAQDNPAHTPQTVIVEGGKQGTEAVNSTFITTLTEDFSGPALEGITVSPTTVVVRDTVTFTTKATDESGVAEVYAYLNFPNGMGFKEIPLVLNTATQEWEGTYTIEELDQEGTWFVDFIAYDTLGNYTWEGASDVEVTNPNGDAELPTIGDVLVSPLNVGPEEEFTIRAKVTDNVGVASVFASVSSYDGFGGEYYLPLTYEESTKEWVVSHSFTESDMPGNWYFKIMVEDKAGNYEDKYLEEILVLTNPNVDSTGPTIGKETFTPATASPGESVHVKVPVTDSQSGVSTVYAEFSHVDYPSDIKTLFLTQDPLTKEWVGDLNIESSFHSGVWEVVFYAADNAGNTTLKENFSAFDVINNDGDYDAPVISNVQVTPQGDVQVGESVTVTAKVSDNVGVDSVRADLYTQGGSEYIDLRYDEASDQWIGSLVVQETTTPGFYVVSISAWDTSYNFDFTTAKGGFTVVNTGDHTGPVISKVELDKPEVNAGEQVTISASVEDVSGVAKVTAYYYDNESKSIDLAYDSTLQKWIGTISVPLNVPDGDVIQIDMIEAVDSIGNPTVQFPEGVSFLVHNPDGDFTAPVVENFVMTPSTVKPGESVHFEAKLMDDKSGVKSAIVDLFNSSNSEITSVDLTYDKAIDVWKADYVIPANVVIGSYSVSLNVVDNAGNEADYLQTRTLRVVAEGTDITPPMVPTVAEVSDQSREVLGTTEAGANVTVSIGSETFTGTADEGGNFKITIPVQSAGTVITVTAKDAFGNASEVTTVTVVDNTPPASPTVITVTTDKTTVVRGTTEKNSTVTAKIGDTSYTGSTFVDGAFKVIIPRQAAGTSITFTAEDEVGNVSAETGVIVGDATAPSVPQVNYVSDKATQVTGQTEGGAIVTVTIGTETYTGSALSDGAFSISIPTQSIGTIISVNATDAAGNISNVRTVTVVDKTAPSIPIVRYVSDKATAVTGTAEAGVTVAVIIGTETYTGTADSNGDYSVTIPLQKAGTLLNVRAIDAAGNKSTLKKLNVVDKTAPSMPTVDDVSDRATVVTGTTEGGAYITVLIGTETYTAKAFSNGTFRVTIPQQELGTLINVRSTDAAGNNSALTKVRVVDKTPPEIPSVNLITTKITKVTGTTEGGAYITVSIGTETYTERAFSNGTFRVSIPLQSVGAQISVVSADRYGNTSKPRNLTVIE
ncbi:Ig-like domain-containing protein [Neobacillus vireti]|uniref:Ig-like domain-containing protein n=1 Tax=Neobacillus vireti TaxID=220686 RepID=UPI002FFF0D1F